MNRGHQIAKVVGIILLTVWSTTVAIGQIIRGNLDITGAGARAEGLGGAFIGVADDATSIVWNPAGLTQLERPEASVVVRQISEGFKRDWWDEDGNQDVSSNHFLYNFGSVAYPLHLGSYKLTVALAYQNQVDGYVYQKGGDYWMTTDQTGGINTLSPGIGFRPFSLLAVGASANFWSGETKTRFVDDGDVDENESYDDDWSGFNMQFGVLTDFSNMEGGGIPLRLGASFRTPFKMTDKWSYVDDHADGKWTWEFPMMMGIGASYRIGENTLVAADYELRSFGKKKVTDDQDGSKVADFSLSRKDINIIRVGAEYLIVLSSAVIPVRIGFKTVPTLLADGEWSVADDQWISTKSQVAGTGISLGTGYVHKRFALDVAVTRVGFEQTDDNSSAGVDDNKRTFSRYTISLSGIVYF